MKQHEFNGITEFKNNLQSKDIKIWIYTLPVKDIDKKHKENYNNIKILKSKNVIYAGVDESDEILCPDCKNCVARNEDLDADRPKYCPECGAKLYY